MQGGGIALRRSDCGATHGSVYTTPILGIAAPVHCGCALQGLPWWQGDASRLLLHTQPVLLMSTVGLASRTERPRPMRRTERPGPMRHTECWALPTHTPQGEEA